MSKFLKGKIVTNLSFDIVIKTNKVKDDGDLNFI